MLTKTDLIDQIEKGLSKAWLLAFQTNDTPYVSMKPEYLTTVMLGQSISDWLSQDHSGAKCRVRFEERTKDVATRAFPCMPPPYKPRNVHGRAKKDGGEEGSVDLVIYREVSFFPETIAVFEIKNFDQADILLDKDLARNVEFMELSDPKKKNQIQFGVLTFFLLDKNSMVKEEAREFLRRKNEEYQNLIAPYTRTGIQASLKIDTLANFPRLSSAEALVPDENGQPAVETEECHHIAYGVVVLERTGTGTP
jgi:hypothetical protein